MGNSVSATLYRKIHWALPDGQPLKDNRDREQFIHAVIAIITNNGQANLSDYNFRLLYSRKENDRVVARIVAEKNGVIKAKVEPEADGKDQMEAFEALRKHVEVRLEHLLASLPSEVPVAEGVAGPSRCNAPASLGGSPSDAPPAYGSGDTKTSKR